MSLRHGAPGASCGSAPDGSPDVVPEGSTPRDGGGQDQQSSDVASDASAGCGSAIAVGEMNACAIERDGTLWCWGDNRSGQIGAGWPGPGAISSAIPTRVDTLGTQVVKVAVGAARACATTSDGYLWCWGRGPMEDDTPTQECFHRPGTPPWRCTPRPWRMNALGAQAAQVSVGWYSTCLVKSDGTLWC